MTHNADFIGLVWGVKLWGILANSTQPVLTCTLPIPFTNANYVPLCCDWVNSEAPYSFSVSIDYTNKTAQSFQITAQNKTPRGVGWIAFGV